MDEEAQSSSSQQREIEAPLEEQTPLPKKRGRPKKVTQEREQVQVNISTQNGDKTFTASRPQKEKTEQGMYYDFHHKQPASRHEVFNRIMSSW